ncbi:diaminopimelate epimerase [Thermovirga lienii]|jgi:diaminopimelate epimerase|uniref:diaminopimelate epimerase n=1 Tax=Thermovirga lienii TaxID=336261 RepID=UPI00074A9369|nr:MAG: Diaminopimelate epimerase [Thermovirga lienii]HCD71811.1 diaminopimelate epimerase [Thermovirga lienii]
MELKFSKMNGNGNDFIVINNMDLSVDPTCMGSLARQLCKRRFSIGADGLISIEPSKDAHFTMHLVNSDGSLAEMCGNGARCAALYAFKMGIAPRNMTFSTPAGNIEASITPNGVSISMGRLSLEGVTQEQSMTVEGQNIVYWHLTVGVPHTVIFLPTSAPQSKEALRELSIAIQGDIKRFPHSTNVNYVKLYKDSLHTLTFERGVGDFTLSCGTGSIASAVVALLRGMVKPPVKVQNPGGVNLVHFKEIQKNLLKVSLEGPAEFSFEGVVTIE